ncbi:hypothetical protein F4806DRAFT_470381 [Annulohypoxylon nitens]|nr:hypothetical protein F4806DRAFT_470381 [Annulohypoxylon nitens]
MNQLGTARNDRREPQLEIIKTWRLIITPPRGETTCSLSDEIVLNALKEELHLEDANPTLSLFSQEKKYCATISLHYSQSPFQNGRTFDLRVITREGQTTTVNVEPDDHFLHMTTLYDGTRDEKDSVDLIVVPGLASHPYGSFKSPLNAKENWLRDYLPRSLSESHIRVLIYGYDSALTRNNKQSISDFAIGLLRAIYSFRDDTSARSRPAIFLGHSLGGLIIKQALVQAIRSKGDKDDAFLKACHGFLFFGVPNRGLRHEELAAILDPGNLTARLVSDIVVDDDSEPTPFLKELGTNFIHLCQDKGLDIKAFYERERTFTTERTQDGKYVRSADESKKKLMVTQDSATMIDGRVTLGSEIPLNADHSTMVKYKSENDPLYISVLPEVKWMIERAREKTYNLQLTHNSRLNKFKADSGFLMNSDADFIRDPHSGTLEAFFGENYFKQWKDDEKSPLLWICGPPGQGKSVLAKSLVKHIEGSLGQSGKLIVLSYFCNAQSADCRPANIMRNLILQLVGNMEYNDVPDEFWVISKSFSAESTKNLLELFTRIVLQVRSKQLYCIIDALDECPRSPSQTELSYPGYSERYIMITGLKKLSLENKPHIKLFITSRPDHDDINSCFQNYRQALTVPERDLSIFIEHELSGIKSLDKIEGIKDEVQEQLLHQSGNTFLWVSLIIHELSLPISPTRRKIKEILKSIPTKLETMYEKIFNLLAKRSESLREILIWVVYAKRPLTVAELRDALTYDPCNADDSRYTFLSEMEDHQPFLDESTIEESLGSLLTVRKPHTLSPGYIYFRHQSGKDFFASKERLSLLRNHGDPNPDIRIANTCLSFLNAKGFDKRGSDLSVLVYVPYMSDVSRNGPERYDNISRGLSASYPLLDYASTSWHKHVHTIHHSGNEGVQHQINRLVDKNQDTFTTWVLSFIESELCKFGIFRQGIAYVWPMVRKRKRLFPTQEEDYPFRALVSIILHLSLPWLIENVSNDDLKGHDYELVTLVEETFESFYSLCSHRKEQMTQILSSDFFDNLFSKPNQNRYKALCVLFEYAPQIKSMVTDESLESINPSHDDYCDLIQFFFEKGFAITNDYLRRAAESGKEGALNFLLSYCKADPNIFDELLHIAIKSESDVLPELLNSSWVDFQITKDHFISAIQKEKIGSFTNLLTHRNQEKTQIGQNNYVSYNDIMERLLCQGALDDSDPRWDTLEWRESFRSKIEFTKKSLLLLYEASRGRVVVTESMLIKCIENIILAENTIEFLLRNNTILEVTGDVITVFAKYWLDKEEKLRHGISEFQANKSFDYIRPSQPFPYLSYHTWRASLSAGKVMSIFLDLMDPDCKSRNDLLYSAIGENGDILLNSLRNGQENLDDQWTTLHYASYFNDVQVITTELEFGADVDGITPTGLTPLHIAILGSLKVMRADEFKGCTLSNEVLGDIINLLLQNKANPNIADIHGDTPLHYAAFHYSEEIFGELFQCDVNAQDENGFIPLHYVVLQGGFDALDRMLFPHIYKGNDSRVHDEVDWGNLCAQGKVGRLNSTDIIFQTPLHYAIQNRDKEKVELLQGGSNLSLLDAYGRSCVESMQENRLESPSLLNIQPTSPSRRNTRIRNVVYIITSRLLNNKSGSVYPGFYELGNCLAFLGKREEAVAAYEQVISNLVDYNNLFCKDCGDIRFWARENPNEPFYIPMDCPTMSLCGYCREQSYYTDTLTVPGLTYLNRDKGFANDAGESVFEWLERIRREFGIDPQAERVEEDDTSRTDGCDENEVLGSHEEFSIDKAISLVDHTSANEDKITDKNNEVLYDREEAVLTHLVQVEPSQSNQTGNAHSAWSQLREAAFDMNLWLVAVTAIASAYAIIKVRRAAR